MIKEVGREVRTIDPPSFSSTIEAAATHLGQSVLGAWFKPSTATTRRGLTGKGAARHWSKRRRQRVVAASTSRSEAWWTNLLRSTSSKRCVDGAPLSSSDVIKTKSGRGSIDNQACANSHDLPHPSPPRTEKTPCVSNAPRAEASKPGRSTVCKSDRSAGAKGCPRSAIACVRLENKSSSHPLLFAAARLTPIAGLHALALSLSA